MEDLSSSIVPLAWGAAGVVVVLWGLLNCFYGYRVFRIVVTLCGFVLFSCLAWKAFEGDEAGNEGLRFAVSALAGLVGAFIAYPYAIMGLAMLGATLGMITAGVVMIATDIELEWKLALYICLPCLCCVLALIFRKAVIIIGTAFFGACCVVWGSRIFLALMPSQPFPGRGEFIPAGTALLAALSLCSMGVVVQTKLFAHDKDIFTRQRHVHFHEPHPHNVRPVVDAALDLFRHRGRVVNRP